MGPYSRPTTMKHCHWNLKYNCLKYVHYKYVSYTPKALIHSTTDNAHDSHSQEACCFLVSTFPLAAFLLLGFTSMDTDLEQQLRLVEQELSQVQGLFFCSERIDKHLLSLVAFPHLPHHVDVVVVAKKPVC